MSSLKAESLPETDRRRRHLPGLGAVAALIRDEAGALMRDAIARRGQAQLLVSGGNTPGIYLKALAQAANLDWRRVTIRLSDERFVDVSHSDSNESMARRALGEAGAQANWVGMRGRDTDPADAARAASKEYAALPWPVDVGLFGMGPDGHVASIFPSSTRLDKTAPVLATTAPNGGSRLTLAPEYVSACRHIFLIAGGNGKIQALDKAMKPGSTEALPVRHLLDASNAHLEIIIFDYSGSRTK